MVVAVAVANLHRHAAVERVGDAFGGRAAFERFCTGHIDDVLRAGRFRHGGDNVGAIEPVMTLPYFLKAASETF